MKEVAERLSGQFFGSEQVLREVIENLNGCAVDPRDMLLIGDWQYKVQRGRTEKHANFTETPRQWREDCPIDWIETASYLSSVVRFVSARLCFLGYSGDDVCGLPPSDSNGLAAGKTVEDAAARAFVELVERDAVAIWWYNKIKREKLNPNKLDDPLPSQYAEWSKRRNRIFGLHNLTHDLNIPVVAAMSHDLDGSSIALGFGAGRSASDAAKHAVEELAQFEANVYAIRTTAIKKGPGALLPNARSLLDWTNMVKLQDHSHLLGEDVRKAPERKLSALDLDFCHWICGRHQLLFLALDLTRPSIGTPVARVIVPSLRPIKARFAAGRLYNVPLLMGWRNVPTAPSALKSIPPLTF